MADLEYLMVYTESGLPIYSKCFGTFCKTAFKNPELLSGFLSALQTLPLTISTDLSLDSVRMGPTEMRFSRTTPSGHTIVAGLHEDNKEVAVKVFDEVSKILGSERFVNIDWSFISSDIMEEFETQLLKSALVDALHDHGGFEDQCPLGDNCPIHTNALQYKTKRVKVWEMIKGKYASMKAKMSGSNS
ncbi:hypothetical protein EU527_07030 [Candidatus Thorarchaeota archaeon]|nr:MAG: hypothetical protein EU527_07030 [Candidatus Thorarchaeota archaeon]